MQQRIPSSTLPQIELDDHPARDEWAEFFQLLGRGEYRSSYQYGEAMRCLPGGRRVIRLMVKDSQTGVPLGVLQAVGRRRPLSRLQVGGSSGGGPIVLPNAAEKVEDVAKMLMDGLEEKARRSLASACTMHCFSDQEVLPAVTGYSKFELVRNASIFLVDLQGGEAAAWSRMASPKRRNVRHAERQGVEVAFDSGDEGLSLFYEMYSDFAERRSFSPMDRDWLRTMWDWLAPAGMARVFVASFGESPVASALVLSHSRSIFCPYTCYTEGAKPLRANDMLHWKIIEWGSKNGFVEYNMGEVFPDSSSKHYGVYKWKKGFGGGIAPMSILRKRFLPLPAWIKRLTVWRR